MHAAIISPSSKIANSSDTRDQDQGAQRWSDYVAHRKEKIDKVFMVLPAYNEAECLPNLFQRFIDAELHEKLPITLLVVDDGSSDDTAEIARNADPRLDVRLIQHPQNMGLGQAMQTGVQAATEMAKDDDVIIAMDSDDTHDVNLIPEMIEKLEGGADIAIASRFCDGGCDKTAPPFRRLLSRGASVVFKTVFPLEKIRDFTSGYRAYRADLLRSARDHWGERLIEEQGFACMMELLLKLRHWEPVMTEVPMVLKYDRKLSVSKLKLFKTLAQYLKLAIRDRLCPAPRRLSRSEREALVSESIAGTTCAQ